MGEMSQEPLEPQTKTWLQRDVLFFADHGHLFDQLLETVSQQRYATFLVLYAEIVQMLTESPDRDSFSRDALRIMALSAQERHAWVGDPAFQIWIGLAFKATNALLRNLTQDQGELIQLLQGFPALLQRIEARQSDSNTQSQPPIRRFEIDPLIALATPPSYEFPIEASKTQLERTGYSLAFFTDVATLALQRIAQTWPACHARFGQLVQLICYLPDGGFRSCSASRYTGVILIAAKDQSILDVEESLVHEWAHQLLYHIVEICPIIDDEVPEASFKLPWSSQERDLYGYFHAFFVYVFLVKYLERVQQRAHNEQLCAQRRMAFILDGLKKALPDLLASQGFTPMGKTLLACLEQELRALDINHAAHPG